MDERISRGLPLPRIDKVERLGGRLVKIGWRGGESDVRDLGPALLSHRHFIPLRNDDVLFASVRPNEDGNALEWDGGIELSAEWIERLPIATMANVDFRSAMETLGLSLDGMAAQLEISRRLVADYRRDKPIPRHIALATRYLVEHRQAAAS
ncbi:MAG: hypothetical protein AB7P20_03420 [Rhizobiaceae bacterium]